MLIVNTPSGSWKFFVNVVANAPDQIQERKPMGEQLIDGYALKPLHESFWKYDKTICADYFAEGISKLQHEEMYINGAFALPDGIHPFQDEMRKDAIKNETLHYRRRSQEEDFSFAFKPFDILRRMASPDIYQKIERREFDKSCRYTSLKLCSPKVKYIEKDGYVSCYRKPSQKQSRQ